MTLTAAQLAAMPRVTPTQLSEEAYQARPGKSYPTTTGPAGIALPDRRQAFRPSRDPALATTIGRAAYGAFRRRVLSPEREAGVAAAIGAHLTAKYPVADMEVLRRYGLASVCGAVRVDMGIMYRHRVLQLPDPLLLPNGADRFRTDPKNVGEDLPPDQLTFFDDVAATIAAERDFMAIQTWPSSFKAREGRWPRWSEIETGLPCIGAWMASEREQA